MQDKWNFSAPNSVCLIDFATQEFVPFNFKTVKLQVMQNVRENGCYPLPKTLYIFFPCVVVNAMKYHKDCWPFLDEVTDDEAPGYSDVIKVCV